MQGQGGEEVPLFLPLVLAFSVHLDNVSALLVHKSVLDSLYSLPYAFSRLFQGCVWLSLTLLVSLVCNRSAPWVMSTVDGPLFVVSLSLCLKLGPVYGTMYKKSWGLE